MRQKRAKAYRKLMALYSTSFGFRQPYQVLGVSYLQSIPGPSLSVSDFISGLRDVQNGHRTPARSIEPACISSTRNCET